MSDTPVPVSENLKRINAALALREIPDYPAALAQLALALQADPHSALAQLLVGLTYQDLGHLQLAEVCFAQALELEPDSAQIRQAYGLSLIRHERYQEAVALTTFLFEHDKHEPALIETFAQALLNDDQVEDAIEILRQSHKRWPQDADIAAFLGWLLAETTEEIDEAIAVLESIADISQRPDSLFDLASMYIKKQDYAAAIKPLKQASQLRPDDERLWRELSACYLSLHDYEQAVAAADQALQRDPNNPDSWENKCLALFSLYKTDKSYLASLDESLEKGIRAAATIGQKKLLPYGLIRWDVFRDQNVNISAADSARVAWLGQHLMGKELDNLGFLPTCEENWQRAQDLLTLVKQHELGDPAIADANLGYIYLRRRQHEPAVEALRAAIQAAHQDSTALLHVASWINGDFSRTDIERFPHRLASIRLAALSNLATAYWLCGKPEEAFVTIQEAIASAPQDNIGYRVSGCLRLTQGEVELARSDWKKALNLAEDKAEAVLIEGWLATLPPVQE
jgi:Tfp pilus assembly protein PilF